MNGTVGRGEEVQLKGREGIEGRNGEKEREGVTYGKGGVWRAE